MTYVQVTVIYRLQHFISSLLNLDFLTICCAAMLLCFKSCPQISGRLRRLFNTDVETSVGGKEIRKLSVLEKIGYLQSIEKMAWDGGCGKGGRQLGRYQIGAELVGCEQRLTTAVNRGQIVKKIENNDMVPESIEFCSTIFIRTICK